MIKPKLPDSLSADSWKKAKGTLAKFADKMKAVGQNIEDVNKAYLAVVWDHIDGEELAKAKTTAEAQRIMLGTKAAALKAQELSTKLTQLGSSASTAASSLKNNPLVGKDSKEWLAKVAKDAPEFANRIHDEVSKTIHHVEDAVAQFDKHLAAIKVLGDQYIDNRKHALVQMQALDKMFQTNYKLLQDQSQKAEAAFKRVLANPSTATAEANAVAAMITNADNALTAAKKRWSEESNVNTNKVQAEARGNIGGYTPNPALSGHLQAYQTQSAPVFNQIMSITNSILPLEQKMEVLLAGMRSHLAQIEDISKAGSRSVEEARKEAAAAVKTSASVTDDLSKSVTWLNTSLPKGIKSWSEDKKAGKLGDISALYEKQMQIADTHLAKVDAAIAKAEQLLVRFSRWPDNLKKDKGVQAEVDKLDVFLKTMKPVREQAKKNVQDAANARPILVG